MDVKMRVIGPVQANCYILNGRIMIDPGDGVNELDAFIRDSGAQIDSVVLTHGHFDHMLGAAHIKKKYGAKIYVSAADAHCLTDEKYALVLPFAVGRFEPCEADVLLNEGKVTISGTEFEVLLTPGHTEGGLCLLSREDRLVFTGDTLFSNGYGRTDLPGGDINKLFASLRRLLKLPEDYYVYPGHGEGALIGEIRGGL